MLTVFAQIGPRIGFFGIRGIMGALLGFALWVIILWGVWAIFNIIGSKIPEPFQWLFQIARIILIVFICVAFINYIFGLAWF